jgi:hypothetical protein
MHYIFKGASVQNTNDREYIFLSNKHFSIKKHQSKQRVQTNFIFTLSKSSKQLTDCIRKRRNKCRSNSFHKGVV